jgi:hypothetical protein
MFTALRKTLSPAAHKTEFYTDGQNFHDLLKILLMLAGSLETANQRRLSKCISVSLV